MKLFLSLISIAILTVSGQCQTTPVKSDACTQEAVEKISSRGIKLGMDVDETLKAFSENGNLTVARLEPNQNGQYNLITAEYPLQQARINLQNDAKQKYGNSTFGFSDITLVPKDKTRFDGISRYDLGFLDNRLAFFNTHYLKPNWESQEQFVRKLADIFNLPVQSKINEGNRYTIKCGDFAVNFNKIYNDEAHYEMSVDANVDGIVRQRKKKAADEQREKDIRAFKP